MPGLTLDVGFPALPRQDSRASGGPSGPLRRAPAMIRRGERASSRAASWSGGRRRPRSRRPVAVVAAAYEADPFAERGLPRAAGPSPGPRRQGRAAGRGRRRRAVLGSVTYSLAGQPYAEVSRPGEAEFRMLGRGPAGPRPWVGEALVRACVDRARRDEATAVAICTMPEMASAQGIYARLGFTRDPERDWQPIPRSSSSASSCRSPTRPKQIQQSTQLNSTHPTHY